VNPLQQRVVEGQTGEWASPSPAFDVNVVVKNNFQGDRIVYEQKKWCLP
jgi:hypothetical protein